LGLTFIPETLDDTAIWKRRGDLRTNKTPDLIALTEVFGLEHNRLCDEFSAAHPDWTQDRLFEESRKWYAVRTHSPLQQRQKQQQNAVCRSAVSLMPIAG
jgi:hypothetical protein